MKNRLIITCLAAVIVLAATVLPAQVAPAPYITLHYDTIDPAMTAAFEENNKAWVEAFQNAKAGKDHYWRGYQSGFTYAWVSDMPNFSYIDGNKARQEAINEKIGKDEMAELEGGASGAITEHHTEIWKYQADMSYMPEGFNPAEMTAINVAIDRVKPSKSAEFRAVVTEAAAALKKINAPVNFFAYSIPFGQGDYAFVSWGEDRGALHSGPSMGKLLEEALGPEGSKAIFSRYLESVSSSEETDWRVRRDISYVSDEMAEETAMEKAAE